MKDAYYQGMLPLLLAVAATIAVENSRPGTADWEITNPALHQEIEGHASLTSVNTGDPIDLLVNTRAARYSIDVFRMGRCRRSPSDGAHRPQRHRPERPITRSRDRTRRLRLARSVPARYPRRIRHLAERNLSRATDDDDGCGKGRG